MKTASVEATKMITEAHQFDAYRQPAVARDRGEVALLVAVHTRLGRGDEARLLSECADRAETTERLLEPREDWCLAHRVESLELAAGGEVVAKHRAVGKRERDDGDQERRHRVGHHTQHTEHHDHGADETVDDTRQHLVDHVDVARKQVEQASRRRGLEPLQRAAQNRVKHVVVELARTRDHEPRPQDERRDADADRSEDANDAVEDEVETRGRRVAAVLRVGGAPLLEHDIARHGHDLREHLGEDVEHDAKHAAALDVLAVHLGLDAALLRLFFGCRALLELADGVLFDLPLGQRLGTHHRGRADAAMQLGALEILVAALEQLALLDGEIDVLERGDRLGSRPLELAVADGDNLVTLLRLARFGVVERLEDIAGTRGRIRVDGLALAGEDDLASQRVELASIEEVRETLGRDLCLEERRDDAGKHGDGEGEQLVEGEGGEDDVGGERLGVGVGVGDKGAERDEEGDGGPEEVEEGRDDADRAEELEFLVVAHLEELAGECLLPGKELDRLDVGEDLVHEARALVLDLHLLFAETTQVAGERGVERHADHHDGDADKRGPAEQVVQRDEGERHLEESTPGDVSVGAEVLKTRGIDGHEVDNVARSPAAAVLVGEAQALLEDGADQTGTHAHAGDKDKLEVLVQERGLGDGDAEEGGGEQVALHGRLVRVLAFVALDELEQLAEDLRLYERERVLGHLEDGGKKEWSTVRVGESGPEGGLARRLVLGLLPEAIEAPAEVLCILVGGQGPHVVFGDKLFGAERHERLHPVEGDAAEDIGGDDGALVSRVYWVVVVSVGLAIVGEDAERAAVGLGRDGMVAVAVGTSRDGRGALLVGIIEGAQLDAETLEHKGEDAEDEADEEGHQGDKLVLDRERGRGDRGAQLDDAGKEVGEPEEEEHVGAATRAKMVEVLKRQDDKVAADAGDRRPEEDRLAWLGEEAVRDGGLESGGDGESGDEDMLALRAIRRARAPAFNVVAEVGERRVAAQLSQRRREQAEGQAEDRIGTHDMGLKRGVKVGQGAELLDRRRAVHTPNCRCGPTS
ncbi:hypothetical protein L1887_42571 [Cichorium endivia]|nr:hypothetical protein L1887_42571 [Cichorium endivia]